MNDLISRQDAQNRVKEICEKWHIGYETGDRFKGGCSAWDFGHAMESLPSAEKTGEWAKICDDTRWWYVCDQCEEEPLKNRWGQNVFSDFCPNCGADMRGTDNE